MAISCSFFDHVKYPASEFLNRDKDFINNGVLHPATDFALSSPSTPNMTMNAAAGVAWVNGYRISYDANPVQVLTFTTADLTNSRIDLVEIGYTGAGSTGTGVIKVVTGTPAASPLQPQPDTGFMALFAVAVAPNATALTTANVTDLRVSVSLTGATNTPLASSVPASITPNSTGNTGTGTHAAREDHQHPAPATYPPSAHASTHSSGGSDPLTAGAATDTVIGNRTGDPTLTSPASTGTLTQLFSWIMGRIKAITGKTNWYDTPDITLAALNAHKARHAIGGSDVLSPADIGAATSAQGAKADGAIQSSIGTASDQVLVSSGVGVWAAKTLAQFKTWLGLGGAAYTDSTAYATSAQGAEADSTATTVAAHLADTVPHGATASATANTIALRDANGNVVSNLPVTGQNPNILFDPSFRLGSAGWTGIGSNGFVVSFGNSGEGTYLFNSTSPSVDPVQINSTPIPLAAGVTVTFSGEIFTGGLSSGLGAFLQIQYYNGTTLLSASEIDAPNGVGWTRYSLTVTAPTYCTNVVVVCGIHLGTNTGVGFRKIKLEKGSVATTFSDDNTLNTLQYGGVLPLAQVLSGGNKKQTGSNSMTVATAGTAVHAIITFPVAFATAPTITIGMVSAPSGTSGYINVFPSAATATGMDVYVNSYIAQTIGFNWEATGT